MSDIERIIDTIYGEAPASGRYDPGDLAVIRPLVRDGLTIRRAAVLMERVKESEFWAPIVQTPKHFALHLAKFSAKLAPPERPRNYDQPRRPESVPLRPEQMFRERPMHPEMAAIRDALLARILAAERQGFRGPALYEAVLGRPAPMLGQDVLKPAPAAAAPPPDRLHLPPEWDMATERQVLVARADALPDTPTGAKELLHLMDLIQWCDQNPEAGLEEYRRASVQLRTFAATGVTA